MECVQLLLPHCNLSHMHTPLIAAATRDYVECVKLILPYGLPLTNGAKVFVETLLKNNIECMQLLLPHCNLQECHAYLAKNHPGSENEQRMQHVIAQWQSDTLTTALTDCPPSKNTSTRKM